MGIVEGSNFVGCGLAGRDVGTTAAAAAAKAAPPPPPGFLSFPSASDPSLSLSFSSRSSSPDCFWMSLR